MKARVICGGFKTKSEMGKLIITGHEFNSHLFLKAGKFNSNELTEQSILVSGVEMVIMAMKRIDMEDSEDDILKYIVRPHIQLLSDTSRVCNAEEAVSAGQVTREVSRTNWPKLEIHPDPRYLLPDSVEALKATERLVELGFVVLPYCQAGSVLCRQLEEAGTATVMPLGAPIGTNKGLQTKEFIHIIIEQVGILIIVDAGIGAPSHTAKAVGMRASVCLVNTVIAVAGDPVEIAKTFKQMVGTGRMDYEAGLGVRTIGSMVEASSPLTAFLSE